MSNSDETEKEEKLTRLYILLGLIALLWSTSIFIVWCFFKDWKESGVFGDTFGAINSLFSGLAFAGIIYTIFLQRNELSLQRRELSQTRDEFKTQNTTLKLQRFENTFFSLLTLHHQIVNAIDLDITKRKSYRGFGIRGGNEEMDRVTLQGRDVFKHRYEQLLERFKPDTNHDAIYIQFYAAVQTDFGHYFRNLYRMVKLVDETEFATKSEIGVDESSTKYAERIKHTLYNHNIRYKYTSIIRAQLSDYELLWLFYNCLSENGYEKFKPLIEKYSLLKNLPVNKLHNPDRIHMYNKTAFQKD